LGRGKNPELNEGGKDIQMVNIKLDSITFRLKEPHDFSWLKKYGKAFWCVDETGSGCICIGMEKAGRNYFLKIAGVNTIHGEITPEESVKILKGAVLLYHELAHPNLVRIVDEYAYRQFYIVVFQWADGQCLFDHWNFDKYKKEPSLKSPMEKFKELPAGKKLRMTDMLFSFLQNVNKKGYVAVDFYDGSIIYDFTTDKAVICDIDLFRRAPVVNDMGTGWYGTKRLKAPEEYKKGSVIDGQTNLFTLGALIFEFFGVFSADEIKQRYVQNRFVPCPYSHWQLNEESYMVAAKAVSASRKERYKTFGEFFQEWKEATASLPVGTACQ